MKVLVTSCIENQNVVNIPMKGDSSFPYLGVKTRRNKKSISNLQKRYKEQNSEMCLYACRIREKRMM